MQNNWNDYGFETTFNASLTTESGVFDLGSVKILHVSQEQGPTPIETTFTQLSEEYCSLGQTMSYYETLKSLGNELCDEFLRALRDVIWDRSILYLFDQKAGFQKSLIRSSSAERVLIDAPLLLRPTEVPRSDQSSELVAAEFFTTVGGNRFHFPLNFRSGGEIPGRMSALIGYNGSGKTRLWRFGIGQGRTLQASQRVPKCLWHQSLQDSPSESPCLG